MKVCFFGPYNMEFMNSLLKKKLELQGIEILECQEEVHNNFLKLIPAYVKLFFKHCKLKYDVVIIPRWRGSLALPLIKIISKKPILFYSYSSPYDVLIADSKKFKPNSLMGKLIYYYYKWTLKLSDLVIKETNLEIDYNVAKFHSDKKKFRRVFLGADESLFPCCSFKKPSKNFIILYFGAFHSFHGVDVIIEAAKKLSEYNEILFKFCGEGKLKKTMQRLAVTYKLKNVEFLGFVKHETLKKNINQSDVCLGLFGDEPRASRVITNKVFQILCSQKPLITRYAEAIEEVGLMDKKNCILISSKNSEKLAEAILYLKNNEAKRKEVAESGHHLYLERFSMRQTSETIVKILNELINKKIN